MSWETWALPTIFTLLIGALGYFLKRHIDGVGGQITDLKKSVEANKRDTDARIAGLERQLNDYIREMPYQYVLREDFIRSISNMDTKLSKILDRMSGLGKE